MIKLLVIFSFVLGCSFVFAGINPNPVSTNDRRQVKDSAASPTPLPTQRPTPNGTRTPIRLNCMMPVSATSKLKPTISSSDDPEQELTVDDVRFFAKSSDYDCDGKSDSDDNCPSVFNPKQTDRNKNGVGDACETRKRTLLVKKKKSGPK